MTDTSSLRAFIEARLAEDERAHQPVVDGTQSTWAWFQGSESRSERALREVAAKRAILALVERVENLENRIDGEWPIGWSADYPSGELLQLLAATYVDHPEYRTEWSTA